MVLFISKRSFTVVFVQVRNLKCDTDDALTYPHNINESENRRFVIFPAASAVSTPAITMFVNATPKTKNVSMNRNISAPLSATWPASTVFSSFVKRTLCYEVRHDLLTIIGEDCEEQEDGEKLIL